AVDYVRSMYVWGSRPCLGAYFYKCFLDFRAGERTSHRFVELLSDGNWSSWRRDNESDRRGYELIEPALHHGRNFRRQRTAGFACHGKSSQATVPNIREHLR